MQGQAFLNSDLDGAVTGLSSLPNNWQNVPYTDINCQAGFNSGSTPDLTNLVNPSIPNGIIGAPFSGTTFLSGVRLNVVGLNFHEGIMQTVTGFCPGKTYIINFQQAVVKQKNGLDESGSWSVYFDNTLAGTSLPTINTLPFNSTAFTWEARTITFTATATTHTIKFLPKDDDPNILASNTDITGALRMGIDNITMVPSTLPLTLDLGNDTTLCPGETLTFNVTTPSSTYLWQDNSTAPAFTITKSGTYWVEISDNCGSRSDTINVSFNPIPTINLGNDTNLCQGQTLTLNATTPNVTYLWHDNSTNPTFDVSASGTYWVQISDSCGSVSDTININFNTAPTVSLGNDTNLCQGQTLTLNVTKPNVTYLWQDNSTNPTFDVSAPGTYWVQISNNCGSTSDTINVNFNPAPTISLGNDTNLCQGQMLRLNATTPNVTYLWQDNSTNPTFNVTAPGTYWVQISNSCGSISDTINVNFNTAFKIDLGNDTSLCQGQTLTLNATTPNVTYLWQDNSSSPTFIITKPGTYWVQISDSCGSNSDTINVSYNNILTIDLGDDITLCEGQSIVLGANTKANLNITSPHLWQDNSTNPTYKVDHEGTYWVQINNGCTTISDTVKVNMKDCNCTFFVPNSFTPNFDNDNDQFSPKFECNITAYHFVIFNRWGELVFETNSQKSAWNGYYKGKMSPTGVYVYVINYKHDGKDKNESGRVSLLK